MTGAGDKRRIGEHLSDFGQQRPVGTAFQTGGQNRRQAEKFGAVGQCQNVVLEFAGSEILHEGKQARLMIDKKTYGLFLIQPRILFAHDEISFPLKGVVCLPPVRSAHNGIHDFDIS